MCFPLLPAHASRHQGLQPRSILSDRPGQTAGRSGLHRSAPVAGMRRRQGEGVQFAQIDLGRSRLNQLQQQKSIDQSNVLCYTI